MKWNLFSKFCDEDIRIKKQVYSNIVSVCFAYILIFDAA
jgi:hypothetical protein